MPTYFRTFLSKVLLCILHNCTTLQEVSLKEMMGYISQKKKKNHNGSPCGPRSMGERENSEKKRN